VFILELDEASKVYVKGLEARAEAVLVSYVETSKQLGVPRPFQPYLLPDVDGENVKYCLRLDQELQGGVGHLLEHWRPHCGDGQEVQRRHRCSRHSRPHWRTLLLTDIWLIIINPSENE